MVANNGADVRTGFAADMQLQCCKTCLPTLCQLVYERSRGGLKVIDVPNA